jgi:hypothetical protein
MDKQSLPNNNKQTSTIKVPRVSIFSKPNFYKINQSLKASGSLTPKFDKSSLPKTNVIVTQHKGGS